MKQEINKLCIGCVKTCKQGAHVAVVRCTKYRKGSKSVVKPERGEQLDLFSPRGGKRHAAR